MKFENQSLNKNILQFGGGAFFADKNVAVFARNLLHLFFDLINSALFRLSLYKKKFAFYDRNFSVDIMLFYV